MKLNSIGRTFGTTVSVAAIAALTLAGLRQRQQRVVVAASSASGTGPPRAAADCGGKNSVTAEGSTAQQNAIAVFSQVWGQVCPARHLSYNPTGSGAGRRRSSSPSRSTSPVRTRRSRTSRSPRPPTRCGGNPAWNLPLVFGPVAMAYNIEGVDKLVLNGDVLAKIFQGQITKWNDPAIAALNSGATLPDTDITPIFRSDSSGTTDNFQKYLTAAAPRRGPRVPAASSRAAPVRAPRSRPASCRPCRPPPAPSATSRRASPSRPAALRPDRQRRRCGRVDRRDRAARPIDAAKFAAEGNDLTLDLNSLYGTQGGRRLPAGAGHLRDRLLEGLRRRHRCGRQVVPDGRGERGPGRSCRRPVTCRCRTRSSSVC